MPLINSLPETVFTTKVDDLLSWGRASSQWYMLFGLACLPLNSCRWEAHAPMWIALGRFHGLHFGNPI